MVDRDAFTVFGGLRDRLEAFLLTSRPRGVRVRPVPLFPTVCESLELEDLRLIETTAPREQWNEATTSWPWPPVW